MPSVFGEDAGFEWGCSHGGTDMSPHFAGPSPYLWRPPVFPSKISFLHLCHLPALSCQGPLPTPSNPLFDRRARHLDLVNLLLISLPPFPEPIVTLFFTSSPRGIFRFRQVRRKSKLCFLYNSPFYWKLSPPPVCIPPTIPSSGSA